jgi:hypothetical protein
MKPIPIERIAASIYMVRVQQVMVDADLAILYGVETKVFIQAVRRNADRFPADFMFQLTEEEATGRGRYSNPAELGRKAERTPGLHAATTQGAAWKDNE